jgi:hypothetical protein
LTKIHFRPAHKMARLWGRGADVAKWQTQRT